MKALLLFLFVSTAQAHQILTLSPYETWVETVHESKKMSKDVLLISTLGGRSVYLISSDAKVLKKWDFPTNVFAGKLDEEGNLLALYRDEKMNSRQAAGAVKLISKNGKDLWDYKNPNLHHSLSPTNHQTALFIEHHLINDERFKKDVFFKDKRLACDSILEVDRKGKTLWSLDLYPLMVINNIQEMKDRLTAFAADKSESLCHTNSVREYEKTPFSNEPAILVSIKNQDEVLLIEKKTKKVLWQSPKGMMSNQHDARLYGEWVYLFNNGINDREIRSEAMRINVKTNKKEILFAKTPFMSMPWGSVSKSGIIPLSNGNLLIVLGDPGQIWELTPEGELVRKIHVLSHKMQYELGSTLFTAEAYDPKLLKKLGVIQ